MTFSRTREILAHDEPGTIAKAIEIGRPGVKDATGVHALVARCPPLDTNSLYCNLVQCAHFAETSAIARIDGEVCGFVSGYRVPEMNEVLFVWQVAVDRRARGSALAQRMIAHILSRRACRDVQYIHTTVTPSNRVSRAMFTKLADGLGASVEVSSLFDRVQHLGGTHESEELLTIGPLHRIRSHQQEENASCPA